MVLNKLGFTVNKSGAGSLGNETDYYGLKTMEALKKFQCKHDIICKGDGTSTGWGILGPKTRAKLNELTKKQSISETTNESSVVAIITTATTSESTVSSNASSSVSTETIPSVVANQSIAQMASADEQLISQTKIIETKQQIIQLLMQTLEILRKR